jgi:hypothetical protein
MGMKKLSVDLSQLVSIENPGEGAAAWPREPKTETAPEMGQVINNVDKSGGMPGLLPGEDGKTGKKINHKGRKKMSKKQKFIVFSLSVLMAFGIFLFENLLAQNSNCSGTITIELDVADDDPAVTNGKVRKVLNELQEAVNIQLLSFSGKNGSASVGGMGIGKYEIEWEGGKRDGGSKTRSITARKPEISLTLR